MLKIVPDTTIQVTNTGGSSAVQSGDTIQIDSEQMKVTGVSGSGPYNLTVTRAFNSTTEAAHTVGKVVYKVVPDTTIQVTATSAIVANGDTIQVDSEQMTVTGITTLTSTLWNLTVTRGANSTTEATHTLSTVVKHVTYPDRTIVVTNTGASSAVQSGDTIQIENEQMTVTGVSGSGPWTLTVTRAVNGTTEATHAVGKLVYKIVPDTTIQVTATSAIVANGDTIQGSTANR